MNVVVCYPNSPREVPITILINIVCPDIQQTENSYDYVNWRKAAGALNSTKGNLYQLKTGRQGRPGTLLKKRLRHRCFPVNFAKFLRAPSFKEYLQWLLLVTGLLFHICKIELKERQKMQELVQMTTSPETVKPGIQNLLANEATITIPNLFKKQSSRGVL